MMSPEQLYARLTAHGLTVCDIHTHTTFCDGKNIPREMIEAAIEKGLKCLGFSGHAHTDFDGSWCMSRENTRALGAEVAALREQYAGRLDILLGLEQDLYSDDTPAAFDYDYSIGSVHYLRTPRGEYLPVDESPERLGAICRDCYGGDWYSLAEHYFESVARLSTLDPLPTVIGHLDLITKFNQDDRYFDESAPRYLSAARAAIDALIPTGALFEVNYGAISRKWRTSPYPSPLLRDYILLRGGRLIPTGDTHAAENLAFGYGGTKETIWELS